MKRIDTSKHKHTAYPSAKQYERIRDVCIETLIQYVGTHKNTLRIDLKLPAYCRVHKDFPKPTKSKNLEGGFSYNVQEVLNWLHKRGYSELSSDDIAAARYAFGQVTWRLDKFLDIDQELLDNVVIENIFEEE